MNPVIQRSIVIVFTIILFTGCVSNQRQAGNQKLLDDTVPTCFGDQDCKEKWEAAQSWVAINCGMKIQIATDTLIETYSPTNGATTLAARVIKEPLGGGKYRILVRTYCDNPIGCVPDTMTAALNFNDYVNRFGAQKPAAGDKQPVQNTKQDTIIKK